MHIYLSYLTTNAAGGVIRLATTTDCLKKNSTNNNYEMPVVAGTNGRCYAAEKMIMSNILLQLINKFSLIYLVFIQTKE